MDRALLVALCLLLLGLPTAVMATEPVELGGRGDDVWVGRGGEPSPAGKRDPLAADARIPSLLTDRPVRADDREVRTFGALPRAQYAPARFVYGPALAVGHTASPSCSPVVYLHQPGLYVSGPARYVRPLPRPVMVRRVRY